MQSGEVAEWSKAPHSKCGVPERVPWVQIPPSPLCMCNSSVGIATLAQLVEQCFRKAKVPGSNPGGGSERKKGYNDGMSHESFKKGSAEPEQLPIDFDQAPPIIDTPRRFRAVCFDNSEEGSTMKELTESGGKFYDDDGSIFELERKGIYRLKKFFSPGYKDLYEKIKAANPGESEGYLEYLTRQKLKKERTLMK